MLRATCPDETYRDGQQALAFAKQAVELNLQKFADAPAAMAAACAELGDFEQAAEWQTKAIELCWNDKDKAKARERLAVYQAGKPWREPVVVAKGGNDDAVRSGEAE
jgi:serine/threonine-protein kinase